MAYVNLVSNTETSLTVNIKGLSSPQNTYNRFRFRINSGSWRYILDDSSYSGYESRSYTFNSLTAGTSYYVEGECETNAWYPTDPKWLSTKEPIKVPSAITGLTVTSTTSNSISLSWNSSSDADSYEIYKSTSGVSGDFYVATTSNTSYKVSGLNEYTYYNLSVVPKNSLYKGTKGELWKYTDDITIPTVSITSVENGIDKIVLNVQGTDSGSGISGFYFYLNGAFKKTVYSDSGGNGSYTFPTLSPNTQYTVGVEAFDKYLNSSSRVTQTVTTKLNRPTNWKWKTGIDANGRKLGNLPFTMLASEWNDFTAKINEFLLYKFNTQTSFTTVYSGGQFKASYFNEAKNAIGGMEVTNLPNQSKYNQITSSKLNILMDTLNSIV